MSECLICLRRCNSVGANRGWGAGPRIPCDAVALSPITPRTPRGPDVKYWVIPNAGTSI